MLILDGDGIDKRNSHDGQIKTRLEAFLEMIVSFPDKMARDAPIKFVFPKKADNVLFLLS